MPSSWPPAALQAQAICARTYVLAAQRSAPRLRSRPVRSSISVYDGHRRRKRRPGIAAVDATAGAGARVSAAATPRSRIRRAAAGTPRSSADAWGSAPIPYLGGVVCTYCTHSPNYRWSATLALRRRRRALFSQPAPFGALHDVDDIDYVLDERADARAAFELVTDLGSATISGSAFRLAGRPRVRAAACCSPIFAARPGRQRHRDRRRRPRSRRRALPVGRARHGARRRATRARNPRALLSRDGRFEHLG